VFVFLDVEPGTTLSQNYWDGWAGAVRDFTVTTNPFTEKPFRPCVFCDPTDSDRCQHHPGQSHFHIGDLVNPYFGGSPADMSPETA